MYTLMIIYIMMVSSLLCYSYVIYFIFRNGEINKSNK